MDLLWCNEKIKSEFFGLWSKEELKWDQIIAHSNLRENYGVQFNHRLALDFFKFEVQRNPTHDIKWVIEDFYAENPEQVIYLKCTVTS